MRKIILALLFFCMGLPPVFAQKSYSVKGVVIDTTANAKLANTSISVLNSKDSTLVKFTRAAADGSFSIENLAVNKFILLLTYPGYADYVEHFKLDSSASQKDFGSVNLILKENLLKEVLIKGEAIAIKIVGDTTEYNAAAFKIEPNSKVEDLLKQLPGIQVDQNGKITAQGETVSKVLVDGEEFFGDDPTLVTKNLRGDMVDKVQLFDKKSDQATFTGIDDGQKTKTLNIKLKEDKKKGYFGKIDAGATPDDFYQGQGMFNYFKAKRKFSAYGTVGNTGKTGLSWQDNTKYGSSGLEIMEGGGVMISGGGRDELESYDGRYNGQGIPLARTGGLH
ncbi:MAG TPA: carboxypeptidase-like regulatory domain-containing protein, partial [Sphingobacteriaceae bacterium]